MVLRFIRSPFFKKRIRVTKWNNFVFTSDGDVGMSIELFFVSDLQNKNKSNK